MHARGLVALVEPRWWLCKDNVPAWWGQERERRQQLKGCCQKWKAETKAEGQIRGVLSWRCSSCPQEATEPASACGMSRQVRDVLGFATMPQRIIPPEAGMCGITTSKQPRSLSWIYVPIAGVQQAIAARSEVLIPICLVNVDCVCMHYCEILGRVVGNFSCWRFSEVWYLSNRRLLFHATNWDPLTPFKLSSQELNPSSNTAPLGVSLH